MRFTAVMVRAEGCWSQGHWFETCRGWCRRGSELLYCAVWLVPGYEGQELNSMLSFYSFIPHMKAAKESSQDKVIAEIHILLCFKFGHVLYFSTAILYLAIVLVSEINNVTWSCDLNIHTAVCCVVRKRGTQFLLLWLL